METFLKRRRSSYIQLIALLTILNGVVFFALKDLLLYSLIVLVTVAHLIILFRMFKFPAYIEVVNSDIVVHSLFADCNFKFEDVKEIKISLSPFGLSYFFLHGGEKILLIHGELSRDDQIKFEEFFSSKIKFIS